MKKLLRKSISLLLVLLMLTMPLTLTGCSVEESTVKLYEPLELEEVTQDVVADDGINQLVWDVNERAVFFYNTMTGRIWSTIPYEFYVQQVEAGYNVMEMKSPIHIAYYAVDNRQERTMTGYEGALLNGTVGSTLIENGIRVEYDFAELELRVPVEYTLQNGNLSIRLDIDGIAEGANYKLTSVSLSPYMASVPEDDTSYLFVPSGSGALMHSDVRNTIRKYSEPIYGIDAIEQPATRTTYAQTAHLPVFGANRGDGGLLGIITQGAGLASINALAGDERIGWACVYPTFQLRGSDMVDIQNRESVAQKVKNYSKNLVDLDYAEVIYQQLEGDQAGYEGMANAYRQWLIDNNGLTQKTTVDSYLALEFLGGVTVKDQIFGISFNRMEVATDLNQVQEILADINDQMQTPITTVLTGFGKGGVDKEYLAGGYQIDKQFGSAEDMANLNEWTANNGGLLFTNFDLLYFRKNGYGVNQLSDVAYRANNVASKAAYYSPVTNRPETDMNYYSLVRRDKLASLAQTLLEKFSSIGSAGVGLSSLGSTAYSDYRSTGTYARNGIEEAVQNILNLFNEQGTPVMSGANAYAAVTSDLIWDVPAYSSQYLVLDEDVPFYQMVFRGYVPMTSTAINREANPDEAFLQALSLGVIPMYSVCATYPEELRDTVHDEFSSGYWAGYRDSVVEKLAIVNDVFPVLGDAGILSYTKDGDLSVTQFDNGVTLYVNYGDTELYTDGGVVEAGSYLLW
ncbi:MAG: hypothetical protein IKU51_00725 [Clostridia bacterium]|nr:hypothetical protein [Clostridia bacterium]